MESSNEIDVWKVVSLERLFGYSLHRRFSHRKTFISYSMQGMLSQIEELFHEASRVLSHEEIPNNNSFFGVKGQKWLDA